MIFSSRKFINQNACHKSHKYQFDFSISMLPIISGNFSEIDFPAFVLHNRTKSHLLRHLYRVVRLHGTKMAMDKTGTPACSFKIVAARRAGRILRVRRSGSGAKRASKP